MADALASLTVGVVFGFALAAPPGPMNAIIAEESVRRGWRAGFAAGLGAMLADGCFFVLSAVGVAAAVQSAPALRGAMVGVGGLLMYLFAYGAVRDADAFLEDGPSSDGGRGFWKTLALGLTNPYQIAFWLTVGMRLLEPGTGDPLAHVPYVGETLAGTLVVRTGSPALIVGLFLGIGVWIVGFPMSLVGMRRRVGDFAPVVSRASAVLLALFGTWFLIDAVAILR